jgi:hypothetical protein
MLCVGMNATGPPLLDRRIDPCRVVREPCRAVDGGSLICSDNARTFAEHSSRFLFGLVVIDSRGNSDFQFIFWRVYCTFSIAPLLSWCTTVHIGVLQYGTVRYTYF